MASSPCGVRGVITMKMISSTRSTSMSGVTLIFAWTRPTAAYVHCHKKFSLPDSIELNQIY